MKRPRNQFGHLPALIVVSALLGSVAPPAQASTGGAAHAVAVDAVVADLNWTVTSQGAAGAVAGIPERSQV